MSNANHYANSGHVPSDPLEDERLRLARMLIDALSPESRDVLARELAEYRDNSGDEGTPTGVLFHFLRLVPKGKEVTAATLRKEIAQRGVNAEPKDVYNAIGYLARTGKLKRVGYGRYVVDGVEIATSDNFGGERDRLEDVSDDE